MLTTEIHCSIQNHHDIFKGLKILLGVENIGLVGKQIKVKFVWAGVYIIDVQKKNKGPSTEP